MNDTQTKNSKVHLMFQDALPGSCFFPIFGRYFHSPTDTKELIYDPASVMNGDTLKFCQKEAWCKMSFFVLSFFYYLYWWVDIKQLSQPNLIAY